MRRLLLVLSLASASLFCTSVSVRAQTGDPNDVMKCFGAGYTTVIAFDGTDRRFQSIGECTLYVLRGGTLIPMSKVARCLDGGYKRLTTSNATTSFTPYDEAGFATEASCVLYMSEGGKPINPGNLVFESFVVTNSSGTQTFALRGSLQLPETAPDGGFTFDPIPAAGAYFYQGPRIAALGTTGTFTSTDPNLRHASVIGYCKSPTDVVNCTQGFTTCADALAHGSVGLSLAVTFVPANRSSPPIPSHITLLHSPRVQGWAAQVQIGTLATYFGTMYSGITLHC